MLRRSPALGPLLAATFIVVGCQEPVTSPESAPIVPAAPSHALSTNPLAPSARLTPSASAPSVDKLFGEYGSRAINAGSYVCSNASPINDYLNTEIGRTLGAGADEADRFWTMYDLAADQVPTYEALVFETTATPQTFGYTGEFTKIMGKTERTVKSFWDIPSAQIQVVAMHGTTLLDTLRVSQTYQFVYGLDAATADVYAGLMRDALRTSTTMNGGNYAFWTFNSVSFRDRADGLPDKIVMGDGILEAYASLGYSDVAPQAIFAHEFAHQIQYENGYFSDLATASAPEQTRYTELMADAMSAYYLTHARGEAMNRKRVEEFLQVFYAIGDCAFTNPGHHGTPNQRMKAAQFGFTVADEFPKQGHILTSKEFYDRFVAYYPTLIAPDAPAATAAP